jgi:hypothetical protein
MTDQAELFDEITNPLDCVEDILAGQNWSFSRMNDAELMVDVSGKLGTYRMVLVWQEEYCAMQFTCHLDMIVPPDRRDLLAIALGRVNAAMWLGHFDIPDDTGVPCFRHTSLFRGQTGSTGADHLQDLMDIALNECERVYPTFTLLSDVCDFDENQLNLALSDTAGEA